MPTDTPAGKDAMGFAGLAALVSTVPDPAPAVVAAPRGGRVLAGIAGIGIFALVRLLSSSSAPVAPNLQPIFTTPTYAPPTYAPPTFETRTITAPGLISEVKPPPGTDLWLSSSQILYCLAQQIRLDAMEPMVDTTSAAQLSGFNALVDDYNLRCLSYRYRNTDMEAARMRVELFRPSLATQAKDQVAAWR